MSGGPGDRASCNWKRYCPCAGQGSRGRSQDFCGPRVQHLPARGGGLPAISTVRVRHCHDAGLDQREKGGYPDSRGGRFPDRRIPGNRGAWLAQAVMVRAEGLDDDPARVFARRPGRPPEPSTGKPAPRPGNPGSEDKVASLTRPGDSWGNHGPWSPFWVPTSRTVRRPLQFQFGSAPPWAGRVAYSRPTLA